MEYLKKYGLIVLIALAMSLLVAVSVFVRMGDLMDYMTIQTPSYGQTLALSYDEYDDAFDLFLTAYTTREEVHFDAPLGVTVRIFDETTDYGNSLAGVPFQKELQLELHSFFKSEQYKLRIWQTADLPTTYIETERGTMNYIHESLDNKRQVVVSMIDSQGERILYRNAEFSGRGNGSWGMDKRPYNLEFSEPVTVGPFEEIRKLCLLTEFSDGSKLRNSLSYYAARQLGHPYASAYLYTNLYIDGEYYGLYGIATKQEYEKHIESDGIQAVFEYCSYEKENTFVTDAALQRFRVIYGDFDRVRDVLNRFTSALQAQNWEACEQMADLPSIAKKMVLEEFTGNHDMTFSSQYFYLDDHGVIHAMLPWDYDWTFGNAVMYHNEAAAYQILAYNLDFWYARLLEYEPFRQMAVEELETQYTDTFLQTLEEYLHQTADQIAVSRDCNAQRWKNGGFENHWEPRYGEDTLLAAKEKLISFIWLHRDFLLEYYKAPEDYCRVEFRNFNYSNVMVKRGEPLEPYLTSAYLDVGYFGDEYLRWDCDGISLENLRGGG